MSPVPDRLWHARPPPCCPASLSRSTAPLIHFCSNFGVRNGRRRKIRTRPARRIHAVPGRPVPLRTRTSCLAQGAQDGGQGHLPFRHQCAHILGTENARLAGPTRSSASPPRAANTRATSTSSRPIRASRSATRRSSSTSTRSIRAGLRISTSFHCSIRVTRPPGAVRLAPLDDRKLVDLFLGKLGAGPHLLYLGSNGRDPMLRLVDKFVAAGSSPSPARRRPADLREGRPGRATARAKDRALIKALIDG